jgi:cytochrome c peroxidase
LKILIFFLPLFLLALKNEPITPIPKIIEYDKQKALLGKKIFFDVDFSEDKTISCASCHIPKFGGADPRPVSIGVYGKKGNIQSPSVYNAVFNFRQFWNGRAKDLKDQIRGPVHNPVEMGINERLVIKIINLKYKEDFYKIYHTKNITFEMYQDVIAEFEKALITPNCKFDRWLRDEVKLKKDEAEGYYNFKKLGCITCHNGVNIGGNSFQKIGIMHPTKNRIGDRYEVTHDENDKYVYKVATLRNIALTAPYFHNAITYDLADAVDRMAYFNLGLTLTPRQIKTIVAFLNTLTGEKPAILDEK